ncbi:hypothetical protein F5Y10DRAFT_234061 [Nemania abortiva]|nr:hypothetical protein F5Y10DRAFT_234061 [Nemania abortiva]
MSTASKPDVSINLIAEEDIPTCFRILSESFGHNAPFVDIYFPNHDSLSGQVQGSNRLKSWRREAPKGETFMLKAVTYSVENETKMEHIMGLAIWTHMRNIPPQKIEDAENVEEIWPDMRDRKFIASLWEDYVKPRTQAVRDSGEKGVWVLELLAIHPADQRQGAGSSLVRWGTKFADALGIRAVIESTPVGRSLYEKHGFRAEIEKMRFDSGEEFAGRTKPTLTFMTRDPQSLY